MSDRWVWLIRYAVVIIVALILAAALGATDLFLKTKLITKGLTASHLVRFLGYGGALVVLWMAAYRSVALIGELGPRWRIVEALLLPVATLIVVASAHPLLLLIVGPLMDKTVREIYDWVFVLGIIGSSVWLIVAMFNGQTGRGAGRR